MVRLAVVFGLLWCSSATAAISTILEPRLIDEMETVRLTIRSSGRAQTEALDLSPLDENFDVLGSQTSSRISSINGRTSAVIEYQINLRPKKTGEIQVPALKIGDEYSEAITLAVRPLDPAVRRKISRMIFFESEFTTNPVYVQAQTILVRRLYFSNGVQIYSDLPGVPEIDNAVVVTLGDTRTTPVTVDGQRYGVIEQRFAIFPEQRGTLTIPAISVTSSIRLQSGGRTRRSGIQVSTEPMALEVLPIPPEYPAAEPWLPAENLVLSERWSPDGSSYKVGAPVNLQLTAEVTGNVNSAIPPLQLELPQAHFKVYPEAPELEEKATGSSITGSRTEAFALIPTAPAALTIEPIGMTWWDTINNRVRTAELPARPLTILGAPVVSEPAEQPADTVVEQGPQADPDQSTAAAFLRGDRAPAVIGALIALVIAAALLVAYRTSLRGALSALRDAVTNRGGVGKQHERLTRKHLRALELACRSADPLATKHALGDYLAGVYRCPTAIALTRFRADPEAAALLLQLNSCIYTNSAATAESYNGAELLAAAKRASKQAAGSPDAALPPLYGFSASR